MTTIDTSTQGGRILAILADGPAMTGEVAAELNLSPHHACAHLRHLMRMGRVTREIFPMANRRIRFLWSLAGQGE